MFWCCAADEKKEEATIELNEKKPQQLSSGNN